jgi:beta-galactosidase
MDRMSEMFGGFFLLFLISATAATAADLPARTRESLNKDWQFARFGPMPDGSQLAEPGVAGWVFTLSASSEEIDKGNLASHAMDGDPTTRWCASGGQTPEWLSVDLGGPHSVAKAELAWEYPEMTYEYDVEGSEDGTTWAPLPCKARHVRVRVTRLPDAKWASIAEVRLFDAGGTEIRNRPKAESGAPSDSAFDDSAWRRLDIPHDWGIEGPFRDDLENNTGKLPWKGIGWYRKHLLLPASDRGRKIFADFDGAMANAKVYVNGQLAGSWPYGYNGFRIDLTPHVRFGETNLLAVRLDTTLWGSRWYPGAGLYRNAWLVKTAPVHIGHWGVCVTTPAIADQKAEVNVVATLDNETDRAVQAGVHVDILDPEGKAVASSDAVPSTLAPQSTASLSSVCSVVRPQRWDLATPRLYTARTTVSVGGKAVDTQDTPFGFRALEFTARDGFKLNGRRVEINGTCNHHDLGPLGAAFNTRAMERQLEILKEMGCNALRTSHNPPAPELLELADRMGFLVQVEAFDCWRGGKTANDYSRIFEAWHEKDLRAMVRHFRNHPSVFMWSIGNEIHEQNGPGLARQLADIVRSEDKTRPVTAGCNNAGAGYNGFQTAVDVFGLNYNLGHFGRFHQHPGNENRPAHSSESSSCISSRGEYFFPVERGNASHVNFQISSYDVDAPGWACPPDDVFETLDRNRAFMGEFVWTGFDYLGEPTPYNSDVSNLLNFSDPAQKEAMRKELDRLGKIEVPSRSSYFGIVDLAGFKKDRFYSYQARWRPDLPMAHIFPHWNWPERTGQVTPVHVYTSGDEAELFLNGKSMGRKKKGEYEYRLRWNDVVYEPGELKVVAYRSGQKWAEDVVKTTGPAAKVLLTADRVEIRSDGSDLSYVTVTIADPNGLMVPRTHNLVKFAVDGPGEIVAVDNGDAASFEPFQAQQRKAFNGLCLAIVRAKAGQTGTITLRAMSEGLAGAEVKIQAGHR